MRFLLGVSLTCAEESKTILRSVHLLTVFNILVSHFLNNELELMRGTFFFSLLFLMTCGVWEKQMYITYFDVS